MNIVDLIDRELLETMVAQRYVNRQFHPAGGLIIWNYGQRAQFDNLWNAATLTCRGLITDDHGEIVARPFRKFFNLGQLDSIPEGEFLAFDKMDGSLGIIYPGEGVYPRAIGPCVATRGSFTSGQALWATNWLHGNVEALAAAQCAIDANCTMLVEIIYPANRIVVDYGTRAELVYLATIENDTGKDRLFSSYGWPGARAGLQAGTIEELTARETPDAEGFVLLWPDGTRAKVKFAEYLRLHKLLTGVNAKTIWELLANDQPLDDLIELVPDEFHKWVTGVVDELQAKYAAIEAKAIDVLSGVPRDASRKEQAEIIKTCDYPGVVFSLLDDQKERAAMQIWRMIQPEASKPFKEDDQ